jgi:ubiquinone/menaquinone biosynthesis C-methylase UbiE
MKSGVKEIIKSLLKILRLYRLAVFIYCRLENIYSKVENIFQYLYSPFLNYRFIKQGTADGLPFPPVKLVYLVTNTYSYDWFYKSGLLGKQSIESILKKNNFDITQFESILDFGCGCGRMMRQWKTLNGSKLFGTDYNPLLVSWCQKNLPFAEFMVNSPTGPLSYPNKAFDFIYAISIFSHLDESMGDFWISELSRILKPGGLIYMTVMGSKRAAHLSRDLQEQFKRGKLIVLGEDRLFSNTCAAFHPESYVRRMLPDSLQVLDFMPGGAKDAHQDVFLLQKIRST